jgi:hypothetical protein
MTNPPPREEVVMLLLLFEVEVAVVALFAVADAVEGELMGDPILPGG